MYYCFTELAPKQVRVNCVKYVLVIFIVRMYIKLIYQFNVTIIALITEYIYIPIYHTLTKYDLMYIYLTNYTYI